MPCRKNLACFTNLSLDRCCLLAVDEYVGLYVKNTLCLLVFRFDLLYFSGYQATITLIPRNPFTLVILLVTDSILALSINMPHESSATELDKISIKHSHLKKRMLQSMVLSVRPYHSQSK